MPFLKGGISKLVRIPEKPIFASAATDGCVRVSNLFKGPLFNTEIYLSTYVFLISFSFGTCQNLKLVVRPISLTDYLIIIMDRPWTAWQSLQMAICWYPERKMDQYALTSKTSLCYFSYALPTSWNYGIVRSLDLITRLVLQYACFDIRIMFRSSTW